MTSAAPQTEARVVLVTAPGCHLCGAARTVVRETAERLGVAWREDDLTTLGAPDPLWWEQIPLVLVDGRVVAYWRVRPQDLEAALAD